MFINSLMYIFKEPNIQNIFTLITFNPTSSEGDVTSTFPQMKTRRSLGEEWLI